jgi:hypothetical protein
MHTTLPTPPKNARPPFPRDGSTLAVFVPLPSGIIVGTLMLSPLRHVFRRGLGANALEFHTFPLSKGVFILAVVSNAAAGIEAIREELKALRYEALAHVGRLLESGWHCVHGSADTVANFGALLNEAAAENEADAALLHAFAGTLHEE